MKKVTVNADALRQILQALNGPPHHIREIQALRNFPGRDCPIKTLTDEYNATVTNEGSDEVAGLLARLEAASNAAGNVFGGIFQDSKQAIERLNQRVKELEARLEIDPEHGWDGIACRDETIKGLEQQMAELRKAQGEPVAVYLGAVDCGNAGAFNLEILRTIPRNAKLYT